MIQQNNDTKYGTNDSERDATIKGKKKWVLTAPRRPRLHLRWLRTRVDFRPILDQFFAAEFSPSLDKQD